jgi:hypothetical protein
VPLDTYGTADHAEGTAVVDMNDMVDTPIWPSWNSCYTTASNITTPTIFTLTHANTWSQWCNTSTITGTTTWNAWNANLPVRCTRAQYQQLMANQAQRQAEWEANAPQRAAEQARQAAEWAAGAPARAAAEAARAAQIVAGENTAKKLLLECLTPQQQAQLEANGWFEVDLPDGRKFRIKKGWSHNVRRVEGEREMESYCVHPRDRVPEYDNMLAQKLMLEVQPDLFFGKANVNQYVNGNR